jgi:hypothetical protein
MKLIVPLMGKFILAWAIFAPIAHHSTAVDLTVIEDQQFSITEDSPGWDCRVHGNRICGVTNDQGVPAGDYN